jgi:AcrR family transcriptional regulator
MKESTASQGDVPREDPNTARRTRLRMLDPERRARFLDPAETEFATHGFEAASLNRILSRAGMSKGQAYYYIAGKADLYEAVIERALGRLGEMVAFEFNPPVDADDFWRQVEERFIRVTVALGSDPQLAALARGVHAGSATRAALAAPLERLRHAIAGLLQTARGVGAARSDLPPSLLADLVFATARETDRWFGDHWDDLSAEEALRLTRSAVEAIRALCMAGPEETEKETES